jgi:hypothetical protein
LYGQKDKKIIFAGSKMCKCEKPAFSDMGVGWIFMQFLSVTVYELIK